MTNLDIYHAMLNQLQEDSPEIESCALASDDGLMLASVLRKGVNEDQLAAMSSAMLSVGNRMMGNLMGRASDRVMIQNQFGYVIISAVTDELILTVVTCSSAKLGMVFHDINNFAKTLKEKLNK